MTYRSYQFKIRTSRFDSRISDAALHTVVKTVYSAQDMTNRVREFSHDLVQQLRYRNHTQRGVLWKQMHRYFSYVGAGITHMMRNRNRKTNAALKSHSSNER